MRQPTPGVRRSGFSSLICRSGGFAFGITVSIAECLVASPGHCEQDRSGKCSSFLLAAFIGDYIA